MEELIRAVVQDKYKLLYHTALGWTKDEEDAKDLVQDTILLVISKKDLFEGDESCCIKWIVVVMKNLFISKWRKQNNNPGLYYDREEISFIKDQIASEEKEWTGEYERLIKVIDNVETNDKRRKMFFDFYIGYKYRELAEMYDINIGTVKSRMERTRSKIIEYERKEEQRYNRAIKRSK